MTCSCGSKKINQIAQDEKIFWRKVFIFGVLSTLSTSWDAPKEKFSFKHEVIVLINRIGDCICIGLSCSPVLLSSFAVADDYA